MKAISRLLLMIIVSALLISASTSISTRSGDYDPWVDLDDDGDIDIFDIVAMAGIYGSEGEPFEAKAAIEYDSSWLNITDKCGQYFNVVHNFNSTDIIVDISGKTAVDEGAHQRNLGGTGLIHGWAQTYGGADSEYGYSVIPTVDGGYAIAGSTRSFGAGDFDSWLIKTDRFGEHVWNQTYGGSDPDYGNSVVQTSDGGYAIAGNTFSFGAGLSDIWLVKTYEPGSEPIIEVEYGLAWTASAQNTITLYKGEDDPYWNYVRVRIWLIRDTQ